jgi:hypothetical protein
LASCSDCKPGEVVDLGGTVNLANASATISFGPPVFLIGERAFVLTSGQLRFTAPPIVAPDVLVHPDGLIPTSFNMIGFLAGEGPSGRARVDVVGSGIVTASFGGEIEGPIPGVARLHESVFLFEDAAPVPEPGTLVLLASGLVVIARGALQRNSRS